MKIKGKNIRSKDQGTVLIVAMWIMIILAAAAIVFAKYVQTEANAATNSACAIQCEYIIHGAINYIFYQLDLEESEEESDLSYETSPYEGVQVGNGYFWVLRPNISDDTNYDYGLSDEAGKINLNSASLEMLLKLPSMTSELANAIIDWRDKNQEVSTGGAESEYYLLLDDPYSCKNSDLESVEEVFLVKGVSVDYVFGEDLNRNGILDWNENDGAETLPADNANGSLDAGFYNYVTVYSYEPNKGADGGERINVSDPKNMSKISQLVQKACPDRYTIIMGRIRLKQQYSSLIEFYFASTMTADEFGPMIDKLTTTDEDTLKGLVNVNTASSAVLLCLPGLEQSDVDAMITKREDENTNTDNILWVTEVLTPMKAVEIGPYITTNSFQYSADITAASSNGSTFKRYNVVIDTADSQKQVVFRQSLTTLGWPLDAEILTKLKTEKTTE